jgi:hypothetical protein
MALAQGKPAPLVDGESFGCLPKGDPHNTDKNEPGRPGSEHLVLDHKLYLVLSRIGVSRKTHVDREPVVLAPEGAILPAEPLVLLDLAKAKWEEEEETAYIKTHGDVT